jgi:gliding motility-associated lipoprotein GldD
MGKISRWVCIGCSALLMGVFVLVMSGCGGDYTPRPRGFLRIDLPEKEYLTFDTVMPYRFEYPVYGQVIRDPFAHPNAEMYRRFNLDFPSLRATLHLTYEPMVDGQLDTLIVQAVDFVYKHVPKATTILKTAIHHPESNVYGTLFNIRGRGAASTTQFYITDSVAHFMRGALYLNTQTDNDSLRPVIDFLKLDIDHFIRTLEWK